MKKLTTIAVSLLLGLTMVAFTNSMAAEAEKDFESVDWDAVTRTVEHDGQTIRVYLIAVVYTSG